MPTLKKEVDDYTISRNSRQDLLKYYSLHTPFRILDKINELLGLKSVPTHFNDNQFELMSNLVDTLVLKALDIAIRDIKIDIQEIENAELWIKLEEDN
mgnify:CR=1 FL=1|tara:strand:- start:539 stop:832 length:294 start_codon:yes stop_codon:yes gene_type:complete